MECTCVQGYLIHLYLFYVQEEVVLYREGWYTYIRGSIHLNYYIYLGYRVRLTLDQILVCYLRIDTSNFSFPKYLILLLLYIDLVIIYIIQQYLIRLYSQVLVKINITQLYIVSQVINYFIRGIKYYKGLLNTFLSILVYIGIYYFIQSYITYRLPQGSYRVFIEYLSYIL